MQANKEMKDRKRARSEKDEETSKKQQEQRQKVRKEKQESKEGLVKQVLDQFIHLTAQRQSIIIQELCKRRSTLKIFETVNDIPDEDVFKMALHVGGYLANAQEGPLAIEKQKQFDRGFKNYCKLLIANWTKEPVVPNNVIDRDLGKAELDNIEEILHEAETNQQRTSLQNSALQGRLLTILRTMISDKKEKWSTYLCRLAFKYNLHMNARTADRKIRWYALTKQYPRLLQTTAPLKKVWNYLHSLEKFLEENEASKLFWQGKTDEPPKEEEEPAKEPEKTVAEAPTFEVEDLDSEESDTDDVDESEDEKEYSLPELPA
jgi:hypothetical protein